MKSQNAHKINFIKHLLAIHAKFSMDPRLSPHHISLYYSLFFSWNHYGFCSPLSISRQEQMNQSKIGSVNTYLKCLKELDQWGYMKYVPSFNPQRGSEIYLYTFDNGTDTASDTSTDIGSEQLVIPLINYNKLDKTSIKTNSKELVVHKKNQEDEIISKKEKAIKEKVDNHTPKNVEEVEAYFLEKKKSSQEAHKYFNYYEANGWMVGKNKMKNWKAAANNWMTNASKFQKPEEKKTYLHVEQNKDYSIPL